MANLGSDVAQPADAALAPTVLGSDFALARRPGTASHLLDLAKQNPLGAFAAFVVFVVLVVAIFGPFFSPYAYDELNVTERLQDPSSKHILGTDSLGRDILSRIIYGARISAGLSISAVAIASVVAITLGLLSGYLGGTFDMLVQRLVDILLAFPGIILLISLTAFIGRGPPQLALSISILLIAGSTRVCRAATLQAKAQPYVESAISLGAATPRIIVRHILPNVFAPLMVVATGQLGFAILIEATASFLGYGIKPPFPSWGSMLGGDARAYMKLHPLLSVWPGLAIFLTVYSLNILGDTLRDVLDPRLRGVR
jgi:peptide/nickel transport system permease protein